MELPDDPMMLFSMVNMKLRDCYHSLDELCDDMNVDKELLVKKLKAAGFEYSKENNKFGRQRDQPVPEECLGRADFFIEIPIVDYFCISPVSGIATGMFRYAA